MSVPTNSKRVYTEEQKRQRRIRENARYHDITSKWKGYHEARTRRYRLKLKMQVINGYGGACTCCGERQPKFLTIEHVNGDGKEHRIKLIGKNEGGTNAVYRAIRDAGYPPEYTILCFNCNIARSLFGACPHKENEYEHEIWKQKGIRT